MNAKQKGNRCEREFASILKDNGFEARRGMQFSGSPDSPDVVCEQLPIHWEVKAEQACTSSRLLAAIEQVTRDAPAGKFRCVAHKKDGRGRKQPVWLITLPCQDFMEILKQWQETKK